MQVGVIDGSDWLPKEAMVLEDISETDKLFVDPDLIVDDGWEGGGLLFEDKGLDDNGGVNYAVEHDIINFWY